jgi:thiol-disulfide isomerase/thioredoxin
MKNKNIVVILSLVFILLMAGAYVLYQNLSGTVDGNQLIVATQPSSTTAPTDTTEPLLLAPDFVVYDENGNEVHLYDYIGKPIVLNFWASWCGPCKMEMPDFNERYLHLGDEIHFLMINMTDGARETISIASAFIAEQGYQFPVFYDTTGSAAMTYGAYSLPTTFFIDAQGHAIAQAVGAIDADTLQQGIDMITSDEP